MSGCSLAFLPSQLWKLSALRQLRLNGADRAWPEAEAGSSNLTVCSRCLDGCWRPMGTLAWCACTAEHTGMGAICSSASSLPSCAGTNLMVGLTHTWEPLSKMPALESVELR